ncbi:MAG: hypothetical protein EBY32_05375, partial [Proteobacteria bacterium]|nr:hypothetical protein [Pseudomonadota bacterium]
MTERRFAAEKWVMQDDALPVAQLAWQCGRSRKASNSDAVGQWESLGSWAMDLSVAVSSGLELFENGAGGEFGGVAVLAQVREEDMAQIRACDFGNEVGC